jgi:hypothetical protein
MDHRNETQFETQLRDHLSHKLDSQLGRSVDRFLSEFGPTTATPRMRLSEPAPEVHRPLRLFAWYAGISGAAIAASLVVAMLLPRLVRSPAPRPDPSGMVAVGPDSAPLTAVSEGPRAQDLEHEVQWRTVDRGTVFLDDEIPLRSLVRQQVETLSWYDPKRQAHVQMEIPRDEVMLVGYNSY